MCLHKQSGFETGFCIEFDQWKSVLNLLAHSISFLLWPRWLLKDAVYFKVTFKTLIVDLISLLWKLSGLLLLLLAPFADLGGTPASVTLRTNFLFNFMLISFWKIFVCALYNHIIFHNFRFINRCTQRICTFFCFPCQFNLMLHQS